VGSSLVLWPVDIDEPQVVRAGIGWWPVIERNIWIATIAHGNKATMAHGGYAPSHE